MAPLRLPLPLCLLLVAALGGPTVLAQDGYGPPTVPKRKSPRLRVEEDTFKWGKVLNGDKVTHEFKLHNDGEGVLKILNVKKT